MIYAHVFTCTPSPALFPIMVIQAVARRRRECSALMFIAFMLGCVAVISLPGFLYFYFWEGAGWVVSLLIGFLLGNLVLSVLEGLGRLLGVGTRKQVKKCQGSETARFL